MKKRIKTFAFLTALVPLMAFAGSPAYKAKLSLKFDGKPLCQLKSADGKTIEGKGSLKHDEDTISWQSNCEIDLPKEVSYCVLSKQHVNAPGDMVFYSSGVSKNRLQAKIVSDADINPEYAEFSVVYLCFK